MRWLLRLLAVLFLAFIIMGAVFSLDNIPRTQAEIDLGQQHSACQYLLKYEPNNKARISAVCDGK